MKSDRIAKYAKWLVSGTSYMYIKNFLDKQDKPKEGNDKKRKNRAG